MLVAPPAPPRRRRPRAVPTRSSAGADRRGRPRPARGRRHRRAHTRCATPREHRPRPVRAAHHRYEFLRPLFPDYPRPAIWPDGYYVPTSTGDDPISDTIATQKHACVADRARMLRGEPATEQCVVLNNVGFLNNADVDGKSAPPAGAPNVMMAAGGVQLRKQFEATHIDVWQFHVDWTDPAKTAITGPVRIPVAPYHYLCDGQLTNCVPQPGTDRRLDAQGDKIHVARRVPPDRGPGVNRGRPLGEHFGGRRGGALVRVPDRSAAPGQPVPAGHLRARRILPLDGEPRRGRPREHRHWLLLRRDAELRRAAVRRAARG